MTALRDVRKFLVSFYSVNSFALCTDIVFFEHDVLGTGLGFGLCVLCFFTVLNYLFLITFLFSGDKVVPANEGHLSGMLWSCDGNLWADI